MTSKPSNSTDDSPSSRQSRGSITSLGAATRDLAERQCSLKDSASPQSRRSVSTCDFVDKQCSLKELFDNIEQHTLEEIALVGTDGKPAKVYRAVRGQIPPELRAALVEDFTEYERHEIYHRVDAYQAERNHKVPKAVWIFGPSASGKTTICNELAAEMFGWPDNAVNIDGSDFRTVHKGFQMVAQHGLRNQLLHMDAWKLMQGAGYMSALKEELVELAIQNRQHLKIPEAANNTTRVKGMLSKLAAAGYEMHAVCLWAPKSECEARGRPRGVKEGKAFSASNFEKELISSLSFAQMWMERISTGDSNYKSVRFFDNTVFPSRPVHHTEFEYLTHLNDEDADRHARTLKLEKRAHEKSDIAASEARIKGSAPSQTVQVALTAFMSSFMAHTKSRRASQLRRRSELELDMSKSPSLIQEWSFRHANQFTDLVRVARRRGQVEGLLAALAVSSSMVFFRWLWLTRRL